jgi:hypothetical protein
VLAWCAAWHQLPAGSLPPDDADLCRMVGLGRDLKSWAKIKAGVMRAWRPFADGRLYHPVVTEKVIERWNGSRMVLWGRDCDRIRKENKARKDKQLSPLELPEKPATVPYGWPPEGAWNSGGSSGGMPTANRLKGREGKRIENIDPAAAASGTDTPRALADRIPAETPKPAQPRPTAVETRAEAVAFEAFRVRAKIEGWPDPMFMDSNRRIAIGARLAMVDGLPGWMIALDQAANAEFLKSQDGGWHRWFHIDWFITEKNFTRLMEGRYAKRHRDDREDRSVTAALAGLAEAGSG